MVHCCTCMRLELSHRHRACSPDPTWPARMSLRGYVDSPAGSLKVCKLQLPSYTCNSCPRVFQMRHNPRTQWLLCPPLPMHVRGHCILDTNLSERWPIWRCTLVNVMGCTWV